MSWLESEASAVRRKVKQVAKAKLDLEITPNMRIGVAVYIKSKIVSLPSLKKKDAAQGGAVRMDRSYVRMDDPDIAVEDKVVALRYGSEYVAVPVDRSTELRVVDASKGLRVLGFFNKDLFGYHRLISGCDCVAAEPGNANSAIALSSLIHALIDQGKVALCRFTARDNSEPKLIVLYPHVEKEFECFYSVQAPFSEDSREATLMFPFLSEPRAELVSALDAFVSSRTFDRELRLEDIVNPTIHRFWMLVQERTKNEHAPVPPLEPELLALLHPESTCFDLKKSSQFLSQVLEIRPLEEVAADTDEEKKRRRFWRDVDQAAEIVRSPTRNIDVKRIRVDDEVEIRQPSLKIGGPQSQLSTQAESQVGAGDSARVRDLVLKGDVKDAVQKIQELRDARIGTSDVADFNNLLTALLDLVETHPRLWRELIVNGVMLISSEEVPSSNVSPMEATEFLENVMKRV